MGKATEGRIRKTKRQNQRSPAKQREKLLEKAPPRSLDEITFAWIQRIVPPSWIQKSGSRDLAISVILCLVTCLLFLPFVGKAYHIDDTLFLSAARQIQYDPGNPYGRYINWYGIDEPLWDVTKNPPLTSYYLAVITPLFGWSEVSIHTAMLFFNVFLVLGIYFLSKKLCLRPLEATLVNLVTPVLVISGTTVMCDVMMLAFWVWAVFFWIRGLENDGHLDLAVSSVLIGLAALTKYFGVALIPLLLVYSVVKKKKPGRWLLYFLIPILFITFYQWMTWLHYGRGLFTDALSYANYTSGPRGWILSTNIGLAFTGGCLIAGLFYIPYIWSRKQGVAFIIILCIVAVAVWGAKGFGGYKFLNSDAFRWGMAIQFSIFFVAGLGVFSMAIRELWEERGADSLLLFLWITGTFVFATFFNWTINGRSILPMVPAFGIVVMRRLEKAHSFAGPIKCPPSQWALIPAVLIAIAVTWADCSLADAGRRAARSIHDQYAQKTEWIWFQGHWGFQYYMESLGARPMDVKKSEIRSGDVVVIPLNNSNIFGLNPQKFKLMETLEFRTCSCLSTMDPRVGAAFYSSVRGPLPYVLWPIPPEKYEIWQREDR